MVTSLRQVRFTFDHQRYECHLLRDERDYVAVRVIIGDDVEHVYHAIWRRDGTKVVPARLRPVEFQVRLLLGITDDACFRAQPTIVARIGLVKRPGELVPVRPVIRCSCPSPRRQDEGCPIHGKGGDND